MLSYKPYKFKEYSLLLKAILSNKKRVYNFILNNLERKNVKINSLPYLLHVEPCGNLCNLKCPLCPVGNKSLTREKGIMTFDTFKEIIGQLEDHVFYVIFSGWGEPLVNKDLFKMIKLAKEKKMFTKLFTNAFYLTEENIDSLLDSGVDLIRCGFDGVTKEAYLKYRIGSDYEKVLKNFENLSKKIKEKNSKVVIELQMVVMSHNENQIEDFHMLSKKYGFTPLLKTSFVMKKEQIGWLPKESKYRRYNEDLTVKAFNFCHAPWQNIFVLWNGTVTVCCAQAQPIYTFGKTKMHIKDYWNNNLYQNIRGEMQKDTRSEIGYCKGCSSAQERFVL